MSNHGHQNAFVAVSSGRYGEPTRRSLDVLRLDGAKRGGLDSTSIRRRDITAVHW